MLVGAGTFVAIMAAAWLGGLLPHDDGELPDDHERPGTCMLWFLGSSSIHRWTSLEKDLTPWDARNRGIDGAMLNDIASRFSKISPDEGRPAAIILYSGENDIAGGRDIRAIARDLARLSVTRDRVLKGVPLFILSMKPSPGRLQYLPRLQEYNLLLRHLVPKIKNAAYVDITGPLLADGMPRSHYREDAIHLSPSGYAILARVVRQTLDARMAPSVVQRCGKGRSAG
ncbi:lysophospholipase [Sphingobium amiense]|uniref:Lysophospholipase n=1 Tax=Sphingobium amiense TaxID=135719 RepID=A0A494W5V7_9SPHN|nr:lysophospholipase [Sphingobium amiense]